MILLLDNYDSFTYNLYQYLCEMGQEVIVKRNDTLNAAQVLELNPDAIIISPGPGRPENSGNCPEIFKRTDGKIPILGICLGHQLFGYCYGMKIVNARELFHGKSSIIQHDGGILFNEIPQKLEVGRYHSLMVSSTEIHPEITVTAATEDGDIMAMSHKKHKTFGIQFHPESLLTPQGKKMLRNFVNDIPVN